MNLGISSYTFGWAVGVPGCEPPSPLDESGLLDRAAVFGIKLVQIGDNLPLHTFDDARLERFAARAKAEGVQLEIGARRLTVERVSRYAQIARQLGASLMRFVVDDEDYHPGPETLSTLLRECAPELDGLTLAIENHDRFTAALLRRIIEDAGCSNIGVCLDTANSLGAGEGLQSVAAELASLTVNLHIKDFQVERLPHKMGFTVTGRPAGKGQVDLPSLLATLAPFKRCQSAILELWTPPSIALKETMKRESEWAAQSLAYLRPFFPPV